MNGRLLLDQARDRSYWQGLNPKFSISDSKFDDANQLVVDPKIISAIQQSLKTDGYFQSDPILAPALVDLLAQGVANVRQAGWSTPFAVVYDQYWQMFRSLTALFSSILGENYKQLPNFWCWYIDTDYESKGWGHHRDRPSAKTIRTNGLLETLTVWIPLTDATVHNGCMYVVPSRLDPSYPHDLDSVQINDPQSIRALPAEKGSVLGWSENIIHWGSRSSTKALVPRISISFTYQRNDVRPYETPLFDTDKLPSFEERLALIGQNVVKFQGHGGSSAQVISACEKLGNAIAPIQVPDSFEIEILDIDKRLSETTIWSARDNELAQDKLQTFQVEPSYCRTPFCNLFVDMVIAALLDIEGQLDQTKPLYFLEIGGGNGCFAYRFLNEFLERREHYAKLKNLNVHYILTAETEAAASRYLGLKKLQNLVKEGRLDFASFSAESDEPIHLQVAKVPLTKQMISNPLIAIANHSFGTMKHDVFRVDNEQIDEVRFTLSRESRFCDLAAPLKPEDIRMIERYFDYDPKPDSDSAIQMVLESYRTRMKKANFIVPTGAIQSVSRLVNLSNEKLLLFAADNGITKVDPNQLNGPKKLDFYPVNSFSFKVNFDAVASYARALGGQTFLQSGETSGACTAVSIILKDHDVAYEHLADLYEERIKKRDLANSLPTFQEVLDRASLNSGDTNCELLNFLAILRTYDFEPSVFAITTGRIFDEIRGKLHKVNDDLKEQLLDAFNRVWKNIYMPGSGDALDALFKCYVEMDRADLCLQLCEESLEMYGPLNTVLDHLALCYEALGKIDLAYKYFRLSLDEQPDHEWARAGLERTGRYLKKSQDVGRIMASGTKKTSQDLLH